MLDPSIVAQLNRLGYATEDIESLLSTAIALSVVALIAAIPTIMLAKRKHRSKGLWLLLALSIPVVPLLVIWLLPALPAPNSATQD